MNTTLIKCLKIIVILFVFIVAKQILKAEELITNETINLRIYNGVSVLMNKLKDRQLTDIKYHPGIRVYWQPEYMLGLGLDFSYLTIDSKSLDNVDTEFGKTDFSAKMYSFPLDIVFSMKFKELEVFGGGGIAFINSEINAFNNKSATSFIGADYVFGLNYYIYHLDKIDISISSKTHISPKINKSNTSLSIALQYKIEI